MIVLGVVCSLPFDVMWDHQMVSVRWQGHFLVVASLNTLIEWIEFESKHLLFPILILVSVYLTKTGRIRLYCKPPFRRNLNIFFWYFHNNDAIRELNSDDIFKCRFSTRIPNWTQLELIATKSLLKWCVLQAKNVILLRSFNRFTSLLKIRNLTDVRGHAFYFIWHSFYINQCHVRIGSVPQTNKLPQL